MTTSFGSVMVVNTRQLYAECSHAVLSGAMSDATELITDMSHYTFHMVNDAAEQPVPALWGNESACAAARLLAQSNSAAS